MEKKLLNYGMASNCTSPLPCTTRFARAQGHSDHAALSPEPLTRYARSGSGSGRLTSGYAVRFGSVV